MCGNEIFAAPGFVAGAKEANTASGLGRLGVDCAFPRKAGNDYSDRAVKSALEKDSVDTRHFILNKNLSSDMILVVIDENNDRFPFIIPREKLRHLELYEILGKRMGVDLLRPYNRPDAL